MKKITLVALLYLVLQSGSFAQTYSPHPYLAGGFNLGYNNGFGLQGNLTISNFAMDFPFSVRLGIGYTSVDPGSPAEARVIFINDATNGVPEKSGTVWDFRMDFLYHVKIFSLKRSGLFIGPRYSQFSGDFRFIDGNEFFNISSNQWGVGLGAESSFALASRLDLVFITGFDYYFKSTIQGHDTSYSPDGETINGRKNYTYSDADQAINQPKFIYKAMVGFNYFF